MNKFSSKPEEKTIPADKKELIDKIIKMQDIPENIALRLLNCKGILQEKKDEKT